GRDDPGEHDPPDRAGASVVELLLTGPGSDRQRAAVRASAGSSLTVLIGGPGTGKTTTVAAMVAALIEATPSGQRGAALRIALAAPTGKAAARLGEAFAVAADRLSPELADELSSAETSTIHRLLRPVPGSRSRFRHHAGDPLPHDVVIVDESSMISLPLMARLLDAVRPDARLVVVGDPGQLASVETGSVLGDIAGPLADVAPVDDHSPDPTAGAGPLARCITVLEHSRRFPSSSPLAELAAAVRGGDVDRALAVLDRSSPAADSSPAGQGA
ncbi:MAG: AAA family ATPase, partial [Ilumatobacteraceae bacterium]